MFYALFIAEAAKLKNQPGRTGGYYFQKTPILYPISKYGNSWDTSLG